MKEKKHTDSLRVDVLSQNWDLFSWGETSDHKENNEDGWKDRLVSGKKKRISSIITTSYHISDRSVVGV